MRIAIHGQDGGHFDPFSAVNLFLADKPKRIGEN